MSDGADTSHIYDSTSNNNDGTKKGVNEPIQVDGQIGKAQSFDGTDDYISVSDSNSQLAPDALTFEAWIKILSGWSVADRIVSKKGSLAWNAKSGWSLEINTAGNMVFLGSGGTYGDKLSMGWQQDTWYYLVVSKESGATTVKGYLNGQYKDDQSCNTIAQNTQPLTLAYYPNLHESTYAPIILDEVRISNVARSSAWIKASYNSGNDTLLKYLKEETLFSRRGIFYVPINTSNFFHFFR